MKNKLVTIVYNYSYNVIGYDNEQFECMNICNILLSLI